MSKQTFDLYAGKSKGNVTKASRGGGGSTEIFASRDLWTIPKTSDISWEISAIFLWEFTILLIFDQFL